jgi:hypothetical protein
MNPFFFKKALLNKLFISVSKRPPSLPLYIEVTCSVDAAAVSLRLPPVRRRPGHPVVHCRPASCCCASARPFVLEALRRGYLPLEALDDVEQCVVQELDTTTEGPPTELLMSK